GECHLKPKLYSVWPDPTQKVALEGFKPETLRGAHSKVPSLHHRANPCGLPVMLSAIYCIKY
ncbi:hypothetical protein A2U01_0078564, partial [Trifolium medium]|nr:hypothetical protein [Trifolium medium]